MLKLLALLLSGAKLGKLLTSGGSMLISVGVYAWVFGWRYAVGFVALLFAHEMGHYIAAKQKGLPVGLPTFIPFVGAWIDLKAQPMNAQTEAHVGMGGPLLGSAAALLVFFYAAGHPDRRWLLAVAYSGFMLNLFNLLPVSPLDGGRITAVLSPRIWLLGAPMLVALFLWRPSPMLILIGLLAAPQLLKAWRYRSDSEEARGYYAVPLRERLEWAALYLGLAAFLALMSYDTHQMLQTAR
jgi:Zn-dependent protease